MIGKNEASHEEMRRAEEFQRGAKMDWNEVMSIKPDPNLRRGTVAGVTFVKGYPDNLRALKKSFDYDPETLPVSLTRNPGNEYDTNACEVWAAGNFIGHLPKELAAEIAPLLDAGKEVDVRITSIGAPSHAPTKLGVGFSIRLA